MTTTDLQQIDQLVRSADMAVRTASQLRLWNKRKALSDPEAVAYAIRFLEDAFSGGQIVETGQVVAGSAASLYPLTWAADIRLGNRAPADNYKGLLEYLDKIKNTLVSLSEGADVGHQQILDSSSFFDELGRLLGGKADSALSTPSARTQRRLDQFSYQ